MEKLEPGEHAPDFSAIDIHGRPVRLHGYAGRKVLLSFFRFATCPFCTVRFVRLTQEAERYAQQGLEVIAVFESSAEYIREYLNGRSMPFPVIADPDGELYARYGLKKSATGLLFGMFRIPTLLRALFDPQFRMARPDSSLLRIPADFLLDSNGRLVESYYGRDIGDHIPFKKIERFIGEGMQEVRA